MIVVGHAGNELRSSDQARSFELYRGALNSNLTVLTFDELFTKVRALLELMEGTEKDAER